MSSHYRKGHLRKSKNGTVHWVSGHSVRRSGESWHQSTTWPRSYGGSASPSTSTPVKGLEDRRVLLVPNARCPVCGAQVFFFANSLGSRVFFDGLGPPWPKHPCTDRGGEQRMLRATASGLRNDPARHSRPQTYAWFIRDLGQWMGNTTLALSRWTGGWPALWLELEGYAPAQAGELAFMSTDSIDFFSFLHMTPISARLVRWRGRHEAWRYPPVPPEVVEFI